MPINSTIYLFTESNIKLHAPDKTGVYGLYYSGKDVIYYGKSDYSIKNRLLSHLRGDEGSCSKNAIYFNCESHFNPRGCEKELLDEYKRKFGRLPKCNDQS